MEYYAMGCERTMAGMYMWNKLREVEGGKNSTEVTAW